MLTFCVRTGIGVFQAYYQEKYLKGYSPSAISWIASLELSILFGGVSFAYQDHRELPNPRSQGFVVGRIYDKYGPRWLMAFGTFMHVFGLMMASLSTKYYQIILSQGICSPIGICCLFTPGTYSLTIILIALSLTSDSCCMREHLVSKAKRSCNGPCQWWL